MSTFRRYLFISQVTAALILWLALATVANAQASISGADESWTATTQNVTSHSNPYRTTESHIKSGNRTLDEKTVEVPGPDGRYQRYFRTEIETIQESPTLSRSIARTYNPGQDGNEHLTQITEAETHNSDDVSRTVQTTSNDRYDGRFRVVEREIAVTTKSSDSQKTQTTVYLPSITGELPPSMQINEQRSHSPNGNTETKKETLFPDMKGGWQVYEVREQTAKGDAQNRTTDDRVSRHDFQGNVSVVSEVISKDTNVKGQLTSTSETSSVDIPGSARDGTLRPLQSSTTVRTTEPGQIITEQQVVQPGPGEKDLKTVFNTRDVVVKGNSGTEETVTVTAQYPDGYPSVVTVETRKSDRVDVK